MSISNSCSHSLYNRSVTRIPETEPTEVPSPCMICQRSTALPRYAVDGTHSRLAVCSGCGLGFLDPQPTPEEIETFYPPEYYGVLGQKFTKLVELGVQIVGGRHIRYLTRMVPRGGRILDVGCGRGVLASALASRGFEVHGFEVSSKATEGADPRVAIRIESDLRHIKYAEDFFDQVILWHVLEHIPDPRAALVEIHRILKPGGEVVVAVPNFSSFQARWAGPAWFHLDLPRHLFHFPCRGLKILLKNVGFQIGSTHHFSLRQNPFGWVQSALNKLPWLPRNGLYELLHSRGEGHTPPFSFSTRIVLLCAFYFGMPIGLGLELLATGLRSGATVHVVARKNPA